jgi:L-alanine-DL-glutamate epimerase-like enolase superfamily enzyme
MMGCMLESAISVAAAAHVASALSPLVSKFDLDGPTLCQFNPCQGGTMFDRANILLNSNSGLGIQHIDHLQSAATLL